MSSDCKHQSAPVEYAHLDNFNHICYRLEDARRGWVAGILRHAMAVGGCAGAGGYVPEEDSVCGGYCLKRVVGDSIFPSVGFDQLAQAPKRHGKIPKWPKMMSKLPYTAASSASWPYEPGRGTCMHAWGGA